MAGEIFAYILHRDKVADDTALELLTAAKKIDAAAKVTAIVAGSNGDDLDSVCSDMASAYPGVMKIEHADLAYPNAEVIRNALIKALPPDSRVLLPHNTFGMDLGPGLSVKLDAPFVSDGVAVDNVEGTKITMVRQEYGGQVSTRVICDTANGVVMTLRPGAFPADENRSASGNITDVSGDVGDIDAKRRRFVEIVPAEAGGVDITKSDVLVSVGRGIEDEENLEIIFDLAGAMGADVSCSRPIVDAKWLEKARQVGTSGQTVKPKVYLALGISGSFQHLGGLKGNPFIVAVNKNSKAPIFQVADVGVEADILDFIPELSDKIQE